MDTIANNIVMSQEMMKAMMKDNPDIMQSMMSDMLETCKNDSVMMSGICKTMLENQHMMNKMKAKL